MENALQDNIQNRMTDVPRRGRPPKVPGLPEQKSEPAVNVEVPQPPLPGIKCPQCGRAMVPRRDRIQGSKCCATCVLCGRRLVLTYENGKYVSVRKI